MPDFTNELLKKLEGSVTALGAATQAAVDMGVPSAPQVPFFRMGEPVRILVSPTSGSTPYPESGNVPIPPNVTTFRVTNNNPFAIRLKGTRQGQSFQPVTSTTGWLFLPGSVEIYTTVAPIQMAAMSVDGPFAASDPSQKAGTGFLELQYGTGV